MQRIPELLSRRLHVARDRGRHRHPGHGAGRHRATLRAERALDARRGLAGRGAGRGPGQDRTASVSRVRLRPARRSRHRSGPGVHRGAEPRPRTPPAASIIVNAEGAVVDVDGRGPRRGVHPPLASHAGRSLRARGARHRGVRVSVARRRPDAGRARCRAWRRCERGSHEEPAAGFLAGRVAGGAHRVRAAVGRHRRRGAFGSRRVRVHPGSARPAAARAHGGRRARTRASFGRTGPRRQRRWHGGRGGAGGGVPGAG